MDYAKLCMNCGRLLHQDEKECRYCKSKNIADVDTDASMRDYMDIAKISKNPNFIKAMLELNKTDIIEYEMKMSQFKGQAQQSAAANQPKCPTCGSTNIRKIGTGERAVSVLGLGILSKKINKTWKCNNCSHTW